MGRVRTLTISEIIDLVTDVRSTRATAAVARLNSRSDGQHYMITFTGAGLFIMSQRIDGVNKPLSDALSLDDFVRMVDSMGPKKIPRVTKHETAFMKQLVKKHNLT